MRHARKTATDNNRRDEFSPTSLMELVKNTQQHVIEVDVDALERGGMWAVAQVEIAGKTYQLFPTLTD